MRNPNKKKEISFLKLRNKSEFPNIYLFFKNYYEVTEISFLILVTTNLDSLE